MTLAETYTQFNTLPSTERIRIVCDRKIPIKMRMAFKRLLTEEERERYKEEDKKQTEKQHQEQYERRNIEYRVRIAQKIQTYQGILDKKEDILSLVKAWDGKKLTKKFDKACRELGYEVWYAAQCDGSLHIWVPAIEVYIARTQDNHTFYLQGKTMRLRAESVIQSIEKETAYIEENIRQLEAWKEKIDIYITKYNELIKQLENVRDTIPWEYRDVYKKEFNHM